MNAISTYEMVSISTSKAIATFFIILGAHKNIFFIIISKILISLKGHIGSSLHSIMLTIESGMVVIF